MKYIVPFIWVLNYVNFANVSIVYYSFIYYDDSPCLEKFAFTWSNCGNWSQVAQVIIINDNDYHIPYSDSFNSSPHGQNGSLVTDDISICIFMDENFVFWLKC